MVRFSRAHWNLGTAVAVYWLKFILKPQVSVANRLPYLVSVKYLLQRAIQGFFVCRFCQPGFRSFPSRLVEPRGLEPLTFSLQGNCAPNCATAPYALARLFPLQSAVIGELRVLVLYAHNFLFGATGFQPAYLSAPRFYRGVFRDPLAAGHAFHHAPILISSKVLISKPGRTRHKVPDKLFLFYPREKLAKNLGRICTGTSMSIAALSAVATLRVVETLSPDRQSGIIAVIRQRHIKG